MFHVIKKKDTFKLLNEHDSIDGRGEISASDSRLIESPAPGIISRRALEWS